VASRLPPVLAEVAPIYRALAAPAIEVHPAGMTAIVVETRRGFSQAEVDEMELWVIAEYLGVNDSPTAAGSSGGGTVTEQVFREQSAALLAERVRRAEAGEAPPAAPASATPEVTPAMMEALAERRRQREAANQGA
jgi:hypothetical protein